MKDVWEYLGFQFPTAGFEFILALLVTSRHRYENHCAQGVQPMETILRPSFGQWLK
jgi:hypothetical protein